MADSFDFSMFPKLIKEIKFIWESKLEALWKNNRLPSIRCKLFNSPKKVESKFYLSFLDSNVTLLCLKFIWSYISIVDDIHL